MIVLLLVGIGSINNLALTKENEAITTHSQMQIDYSSDIQASISGNSILEQYGYSNDSIVFPGMGIVGTFNIFNHGDDTLQLAGKEQTILQFLRLYYFKYSDPSRKVRSFDAELMPTRISTSKDSLIDPARGQIILPRQVIEVQTFPNWEELAIFCPDTLELFWIYDNSGAVKSDANVTMIQEEKPHFQLKILPHPQNREDSTYYLNERAKEFNYKGKLQESYAICQQVFQMDKMNLTATITAIDVLWKTERYDDALRLAQKMRPLVKNVMDYDKIRGAIKGVDIDYPYLKRIDFFIDKCQKREPWQGGK